MKIGLIKDLDMSKGVGKRISFLFTGCGTDDCTIDKYHDYNYGVEWDIDEIITYIIERKAWINGISILGPNPLTHPDMRLLLETIRTNIDLKRINIWFYSTTPFDTIPNPIKSKVNVIVYKDSHWKHVVGHHFEFIPKDDVKYFYINSTGKKYGKRKIY